MEKLENSQKSEKGHVQYNDGRELFINVYQNILYHIGR